MNFKKTLTAIVLTAYSTLASGCIAFKDDVDHSQKEEKTYTGSEAELAYCLVDSGVVFGFGDGGYRSRKQGKVFGPEAWEIMQEIYTECFEEGEEEVLPVCRQYIGSGEEVNKSILPIWAFLNNEGDVVITSGVLSLNNFAALTSDFGCEYDPE